MQASFRVEGEVISGYETCDEAASDSVMGFMLDDSCSLLRDVPVA